MDIGKFIARGIADTVAFGGALITTENPVAAFEAAQAADAVTSSGYDWVMETFGGDDEKVEGPVTNNPYHIGHYMGRPGLVSGHNMGHSQQAVTAPVPVNAFSWGRTPLTKGAQDIPIGVVTEPFHDSRTSLPPQVAANFLALSKKK